MHLENLVEPAGGESGRAAAADQAEPGGGEGGLPRVTALDGTEMGPTVAELRTELGKRKLPTTGLKGVLEQRLRDADEQAKQKTACEKECRLKSLDVQLREAIDVCLEEHPAEDSGPGREGWVNISLLTPVLRRRAPDWDVRNYGVSKKAGLSGLLNLPELSELFELGAKSGKKSVLQVRVKPGC